MKRLKFGFSSKIGIKAEEAVAQFTLTAADLTTLHSAPVSLIAAPGANKVLIATCMLLQFKFGTVQFTLGGAVNPVYHGAAATNLLSGAVAAATLQANANSLTALDAAGGPLTATLNTGIDLVAAGADFAGGGDSTAVVTLWYTICEIS